MIPWQFKNLLRSVLDNGNRRTALASYSKIGNAGESRPLLAFGGVLDAGTLIHGGAVKLLSLRDGFPHDEKNFNILYLVSSAQPAFAADLVRLCRSKGIKFVWNQNGVGYPAWAGQEAERHNAPMRRLRAQADFIVYQSEFCRESAVKFLGLCDKPSEILLNPVDLKKFLPNTDSHPVSQLRLLAMGTHSYRERVISTLECLRVLRDAHVSCSLTIAGPLSWRNAQRDVNSAIDAMGLAEAVTILPPFRQEDAPGIYRNHHILIHPKYMDPCPTVVAEALSCGLPVVASRSGGVTEMVDQSCSALIDVPLSWEKLSTPSGHELAQAVRFIASDLPGLSANARRRAETLFGQKHWLARHSDIFRSLLIST